jgi:dihydrofolate reductase
MPVEIVGHAIVSADGRIAAADGRTPPALHNAKDWTRFQAALDAAALVVLGRLGHERHPNPGRRRLVVTRGVAALDTADPLAIRWNPAGLAFDAVCARLGLADGTVAVTGGRDVFDLFLPLFTRFELVTVAGTTLPDGIACFTAGPPSEVLPAAGLRRAVTTPLDPGVTLTIWTR